MPATTQILTGVAAVVAVVAAGAIIALNGNANSPRKRGPADAFGMSGGYIAAADLPDSVALVPPPPRPGSAEMQRDEKSRQAALSLRDTPRYKQAAADAVFAFPQIPRDFSCALGLEIDQQKTPRLYKLMARMLIDVRASTYRAKNAYKRVRPFDTYRSRTCLPNAELLRSYGSYPSGQSALGWAYGVVLAELNPSRADLILSRGREFGESRIICDAEWQSDVDAGRIIGDVTVGRLREIDPFKTDFEAARKEVASAVRSGELPPERCLIENGTTSVASAAARPNATQ